MSTAENKALVAHAFAEIAKGDGRAFVDMMSADVAWRIIGTTPWSKTYRGKGEVLGLLRALREQFVGGGNTIAAHRILADDDCVVVEARGDNTTLDGARYANEYCWVFGFADGAVAEITEYADTQLMVDALTPP